MGDRAMTMVNNGAYSYSFDSCYEYAKQNHFIYFALQDGDVSSSIAQCMVSNDICHVVLYHGRTSLGDPLRSTTSPVDGHVYGGASSNALCLVRIKFNSQLFLKMTL